MNYVGTLASPTQVLELIGTHKDHVVMVRGHLLYVKMRQNGLGCVQEPMAGVPCTSFYRHTGYEDELDRDAGGVHLLSVCTTDDALTGVVEALGPGACSYIYLTESSG